MASVLQQDANRWDISPRSLYYCSYGVRRKGGMLALGYRVGPLPLLYAVVFAPCGCHSSYAEACRVLAEVICCVHCAAVFAMQHVFMYSAQL